MRILYILYNTRKGEMKTENSIVSHTNTDIKSGFNKKKLYEIVKN